MSSEFVSRGGGKLRHALDVFSISPGGMVCADLGCSTGGFTDCLLQAGAARVYSVDTAYGQLAWKLRNDPRVVVMERQNALHAAIPDGGVDLVVVDLGWTPQEKLVPVAVAWLREGAARAASRIVTLIKPHYELRGLGELKALGRELPRGGVLDDAEAERVAMAVIEKLPSLGVRVLGVTRSPIRGTAGKKSGAGTGNLEWLALLSAVRA